MSEWTWKNILEHLELIEKEVLAIYRSNDYDKQYNKYLTSEDLHKLKQIERKQIREITNHLREKKEIIFNKLLNIDALIENIEKANHFRNGRLGTLVNLIQSTIILVKNRMNGKNPYFIYQIRYTENSVKNNSDGHTSVLHYPRKLYATYSKAVDTVQTKIVQSSNFHSLEIFFVSDESNDKWLRDILEKQNIKELFQTHFRGEYSPQENNWKKLVRKAYDEIKSECEKQKGDYKFFSRSFINSGNTHGIFISKVLE